MYAKYECDLHEEVHVWTSREVQVDLKVRSYEANSFKKLIFLSFDITFY